MRGAQRSLGALSMQLLVGLALIMTLLSAQPSDAASGKVKVEVYVEAYCPRCIDVLTHSLADAMKRVGSIIDLDVIPFGNGHERDGLISCQHGARECEANTIQGCAQRHYPSSDRWFPFILCMERASDPLAAGKACAKRVKMSWSKIESCAKGAEGRAILLSNARRTFATQNRYVPWLVINGQPYEDPENMVAAVCSQYTGKDKAKVCKNTARYGEK